jgi:metal-sulfur cluster biosynthetic enzyme
MRSAPGRGHAGAAAAIGSPRRAAVPAPRPQLGQLHRKAAAKLPGVVRGKRLNWSFMVSVDDVNDALRDVIDPELGLDFVELGLIYDIEIEGSTVKVTYSLTTPACPIGPHVSEQIEEFVGELDGVERVESTMTFSPPWTPERMSEDAKFALGF